MERVAQAAGSLTGSAVDLVGALTGSGQNSGWPLTGSGQNSGRGIDRVGSKIRVGLGPGQRWRQHDVSIRFDRVENGSGQRLGRSYLLGQTDVSMTPSDQ